MKTLAPQTRDEVMKNHGFISQAAALISCRNSGGRQASLNTSAYTVIINVDLCQLVTLLLCVFNCKNVQALVLLLSTCASSSHLGSELLLRYGITGILKDILTGSGIFPALRSRYMSICSLIYFLDIFTHLLS